LADAEARIQQSGVAMGTVPYADFDAQALFERGYGLVLGPSDITLLRDAAGAQVAAHRRRLDQG
jgi:2-keto-3-deoxy-L-rhamnonate aldolase RhmA